MEEIAKKLEDDYGYFSVSNRYFAYDFGVFYFFHCPAFEKKYVTGRRKK